PEVKRLVQLLKQKSIRDVSYLLKDSNNLMEIAEWACIFDRLTAENQEPIIILKDGLLRTKVIKADKDNNHIQALREIVRAHKEDVKLVGVSKTSAIVSMLSTALFLEQKIPNDAVGYVKIPLEVELLAYQWTGRGSIDHSGSKPLYYAFGELLIAKLAKNSNLLVTIEIPKNLEDGKPIYSEEEINDILSYLAKDSKTSYPVIGYPQTIMRAHETAVRLGFPASLLRDELKERILEGLDEESKDFVRDGWLLTDFVDKGVLGGGNFG
ncbi:MAG: DNA double-strand break repair nuclease NurA, partial [Nitrososphaerota archaeon]|nr:DNA double-strand break repair nuclease NurA [Nitrososphaerota archaeon]